MKRRFPSFTWVLVTSLVLLGGLVGVASGERYIIDIYKEEPQKISNEVLEEARPGERVG